MAITQKSRWDDTGQEPPAGEARYQAGEQPIAEYDNWFNKSVVDDIAAINAWLDNLGIEKVYIDTSANKPASGKTTELFIETDTNKIYRGTGTGWQELAVDWSAILNKPSQFPPESHTHGRSEITDFFSTPFWDNIPDKPTEFETVPHAAKHQQGGDDEVVGIVLQGADADRPSAGVAGRFWLSTDTKAMYYDDGTQWVLVGVLGGLDLTSHASRHGAGGEDEITISISQISDIESASVANADKVDGKHASDLAYVDLSNVSDSIILSKLKNVDGAGSGLNADLLDGKHAGNSSGQIPISNGTKCTNLNADMVDGLHASDFAQLTDALVYALIFGG